MNLSPIADWENGFPFKNLMWGARRWESRNADGSGPWSTDQEEHFEFDSNGYPLEVPIVTPGAKGKPQQIFTLLPNRLTPGRYVILHDGEGEFNARLGTRIIERSPGRTVIHMSHDSDLVECLEIARSKRGNHVRNIRVVAEEFVSENLEDNPFTPEFIEFAKPFHALRFMDWGSTNDSIEEDWTSRRRPTFYTMIPGSGDLDGHWGPKISQFQKKHSGGVAHEIIIKLSNILKINPWICIPHRATDEYILNCAKLYRDNLDPDLSVYVEYSNEVWNWQFLQASWMLNSDFAADMLQSRGVQAWVQQDGKRKGDNHPERIGALCSRAFDLWTSQWTGPDRKRVTTVCAVQAAWLDASVRTINWCHRNGNVDAASATGYFGPSDEHYARWERRGSALTAMEVLDDLEQVLVDQSRRYDSASQIAIHAKSLGLKYLNYEGGQSLEPKDQVATSYMPALRAAQFHPKMYELYTQNLRHQERLGSSLFCAYNSVGAQGTRWGSWGSKERYSSSEKESPKHKALIDCNLPKSLKPSNT